MNFKKGGYYYTRQYGVVRSCYNRHITHNGNGHCMVMVKNQQGEEISIHVNQIQQPADILCCQECGSTEIEMQAWVNANTLDYADEVIDPNYWCPDHGTECGTTTLEDYLKNQHEKPGAENSKRSKVGAAYQPA